MGALSGMRGQTSRPVVLPGRSGGRRRLGAPRSCGPAAPCQVRRLRCADLPRYGHPSWRPERVGPKLSLANAAYAGGLGRAKGKNIPLNPGVTTSLLVRPQGFGPALFRACSLPTTIGLAGSLTPSATLRGNASPDTPACNYLTKANLAGRRVRSAHGRTNGRAIELSPAGSCRLGEFRGCRPQTAGRQRRLFNCPSRLRELCAAVHDGSRAGWRETASEGGAVWS